jgi:hypothetical protein
MSFQGTVVGGRNEQGKYYMGSGSKGEEIYGDVRTGLYHTRSHIFNSIKSYISSVNRAASIPVKILLKIRIDLEPKR